MGYQGFIIFLGGLVWVWSGGWCGVGAGVEWGLVWSGGWCGVGAGVE